MPHRSSIEILKCIIHAIDWHRLKEVDFVIYTYLIAQDDLSTEVQSTGCLPYMNARVSRVFFAAVSTRRFK